MKANRRLERLLRLDPAECRERLRALSEEERRELRWHWRLWARPEQLPPAGDWRTWLIMAGRGFGKTRAGAEWVRALADADPAARIALVVASLGEARAVMVEGESGLLAICPPGREPSFEPSLRRLTWPNGAQATLYSAQEPESLRGPQHSHACRPGPEGGLRQRGARAGRRADPLRRRRRGDCAAGHPGRRHQLAGRLAGHRRLGRAGGKPGLPPGRKLAVRRSARRPAHRRPVQRPGGPLHGWLALCGSPCGTIGWFGR